MRNWLLFLLGVLASPSAAEYTGSAAKLYVAQVSGRFSNEQNLNNLKEAGYSAKQDMAVVEFYPLNNIAALNADYTLYVETWASGKLAHQRIFAVKDGGDVFEVHPYDFVHPESFVPGSFEISSLENLTLNDLKTRQDCVGYFVRTAETTLTADWPYHCTDAGIVRFMIAFNCNTMTVIINNKAFPISPSKIPYTSVKVESFPVPASIMPDYEIYKSLCNY